MSHACRVRLSRSREPGAAFSWFIWTSKLARCAATSSTLAALVTSAAMWDAVGRSFGRGGSKGVR